LIRVTVTNAWKSEFTYDGKFRRRIRKEFTWQNSTWVPTIEVRHIYDGNLVIQERDGNNLATLTLTRGRDLSGSLQGAGGIGGLLARTDAASGQTACFHADGNGNVTALINSQQIIAAKYIYDPFGNILSKAGPIADANTYRFSSQEYHQPSGLSLYLYRAYDPNLERWLNRDPIEENGGINLYEPNYNDPLNWVDRDGAEPISIGIGVGVGGGALAGGTLSGIATGGIAIYGGAIAAGTAYIGDKTGAHDWLAEQMAKGYMWCMAKPHGKGERKFTAKPTGKADNPYKGWQVDPKAPTKVRFRDPQDGKWITKPKPPDFPDPQPPKPQPPKTNPNPKPPEGGK